MLKFISVPPLFTFSGGSKNCSPRGVKQTEQLSTSWSSERTCSSSSSSSSTTRKATRPKTYRLLDDSNCYDFVRTATEATSGRDEADAHLDRILATGSLSTPTTPRTPSATKEEQNDKRARMAHIMPPPSTL